MSTQRLSEGDGEKRLYPSEVYSVRPDLYPPDAIDLVAQYIQRIFGIADLPPFGIVRNILAAPEHGFRRLMLEAKAGKELGPDKVRAIERTHVPAIERIRKEAQERAAARLSEHIIAGPAHPTPSCSIEYIEEHPALKEWIQNHLIPSAADFNDDPTLDEGIVRSVLITLPEPYQSEYAAKIDVILQQLRFCRADSYPVTAMAHAFLDLCTKHMLANRGLLASCDMDDLHSGATLRESLYGDRVHHVDTIGSVVGPMHVLYGERFTKPDEQRSPHYDGFREFAVMDCDFLVHQMIKIASAGVGGIARELGPDYRWRRAIKDFYAYIWNNYKSPTLYDELANIINTELSSYQKMQLLMEFPIFQAYFDVVLPEEIRHGIDAKYRAQKGFSEDAPLDETYRCHFKPESKISAGFLGDEFPKDHLEAVLLVQALEEVMGKATAVGVSMDPRIEIAYWERFIHESQILGGRKSQTFARDLKSANVRFGTAGQAETVEESEKMESWEHALAVKIAATHVGNTMGLMNQPLHLNATYDHHELIAVLGRIKRMTPEEIRLGMKRSMDPELVHAIDCEPFHVIDDQGRLTRRTMSGGSR